MFNQQDASFSKNLQPVSLTSYNVRMRDIPFSINFVLQ